MMDSQTGVLVTKVHYGNTCWGFLKEGDVLMQIGNYKIANNGIISFDQNVRGEFILAVHQNYAGDTQIFKILRNKVVIEMDLMLKYLKELVPTHRYNVQPEYFIYCGILFQPLSIDLLQNFFSGSILSAPQELLYLSTIGETLDRTEVVVLTRIFKDEINSGYEHLQFSVITEINGSKICSLADMVSNVHQMTLEKNGEEGNIIIKSSQGSTIILPAPYRKEFKQSTKQIAKQYYIKEEYYINSLHLTNDENDTKTATNNNNNLLLDESVSSTTEKKDINK